ncbi:hypothetical protein [Aestuariibaculum marinum]|uniref:Lipoprotein n=1 Tax=Aestuariibaculum marinum TaxID=2683592 RepID=A0A8J6U3P0_9FLAO|nr:hypothetical protein [Aestuariibaculum marinum]MBD0823317.1 hypothetical protein [Aestuariibaculum marinum]
MKKIIPLFLLVLTIFACDNNAEDTFDNEAAFKINLNTIEIIENQGVGNIITLGMSRNDIHTALGGNICGTASECSFRLTPETGVITVTFNSDDLVTNIDINQNNILDENKWSTTSGATDNMTPNEVAALYPGSVIKSEYPYTYVLASKDGYTLEYYESCTYAGCTTSITHHIYSAGNTNTGDNRIILGDIVVENPSKKTASYTVNIDITNPDNQTTSNAFPLTISGRSSYTIDPATLVDIDGTLGTYTYVAKLLNNKGRVKGKFTGTFEITTE